MRKIILMLVIGLASCSSLTVEVPAPYHDASTQFIIMEIKQLEGMKRLTSYLVEVVDVNDLVSGPNGGGNLKFWLCDSIGKYRLGQPIHFDKQR